MATIVLPDARLLGAVVEQVWVSMLHEPVVPWGGTPPRGRPGVAARIAVTGDWTGSLRLWCSTSVASSVTRTLLSLRGDDVPVPEDVADAIGEVANVLAGSLKGALGGASTLGLPEVEDAPAPVAGAVEQTVSWRGEPILISLLLDH